MLLFFIELITTLSHAYLAYSHYYIWLQKIIAINKLAIIQKETYWHKGEFETNKPNSHLTLICYTVIGFFINRRLELCIKKKKVSFIHIYFMPICLKT
jgi:hypothetical protein